jgi:hypothetical protein
MEQQTMTEEEKRNLRRQRFNQSEAINTFDSVRVRY